MLTTFLLLLVLFAAENFKERILSFIARTIPKSPLLLLSQEVLLQLQIITCYLHPFYKFILARRKMNKGHFYFRRTILYSNSDVRDQP